MGTAFRRASTAGVSAESAAEGGSSPGGNALAAASRLPTDGSESDDALVSLMSLPEDTGAPSVEDTTGRAVDLARSSRSEELIRHCTTPGEGTTALAAMMRRLQSAPSAEAAAADLEALAVLRGDPDTTAITAHYERFLSLRSADLVRDGEFESLDEDAHPAFMASPEQLAYGRVVGDVLGMDPVLASLLNPTGGLVGPGNVAVERPRDSAIGTHGIVHDAMGYLVNHGHGGPGYDYLGGDAAAPFLGTENPLTGQESGTGFWSGYDGTSGAEQGGGAVVGIAGRGIEEGAGWALGQVRRGTEVALETAGRVRDTTRAVAGRVLGAGEQIGGSAVGHARELGGQAVDAGVGVARGVGRDVSELGGRALVAGADLGERAIDAGAQLGGHTLDAAVDVGGNAVDAAVDVGGRALDAGRDLRGRVRAARGAVVDRALDGDVEGAAETAWDASVDVSGAAVDAGLDVGGRAIDAGLDVGGQAWDAGRGLIGEARGAAVDLGGRAVDAGVGLAGQVWDAEVRAVHGAAGVVSDLAHGGVDAARDLGSQGMDAAAGVADDVARGFGLPDAEAAVSWAEEQAARLLGGGSGYSGGGGESGGGGSSDWW